jgi:hypothetical protein
MKLFKASYLKALPLLLLLLAMALYKFRYELRLVKPVTGEAEAIDSSYLKRKDIKEFVAFGTVMEKSFKGIDATKYPLEKAMDSGMNMINNDQFYIIKLYDPEKKMEVYIAIRDLVLLSKIPFSLAFEDGKKVLITAFVKKKDGVNAMYGGTIHNNRGKLRLAGYNKNTNLVIGELDAELDAVIENGTCEIVGLKFSNVILMHNKVQ